MMAESPVSVGGSLAYAWSLWRTHARSIWGVLALLSLAATVQYAGLFVGDPRLSLIGALAQAVIQLVVYGALFRLAFADRHSGDPEFVPGPSGLQWSSLESRMLVSLLLMAALMFFILLLWAIAVGAVCMGLLMNQGVATPPTTAEAMWTQLGQRGQAVAVLVGVIAILPVCYIALRLSLVMAATADRKRVTVLKSWPITRGQVLRLLMSSLMVLIPFSLLDALIRSSVAGPGSGGASPPAAFAAAVALGAATGGMYVPLMMGVVAYYYRHLAGPPESASRSPGA